MGAREKEHYYFIDYLRAMACYLVVLHHCLGYFPKASWVVFYMRHLKVFFPTVTLYLLISGFVHAGVIQRKVQPYSDYVIEKFKRIMVPYFCVSFLTMVLRIFVERNHLMPLDEVHYTPFVWGRAGLRLLFSGVEGHYYFLEILFIYLLFFPATVRFFRSTRSALIGLACLIAVDPLLARLCISLRSTAWSPTALLVATLSGYKFFFFGFALNRSYAWLRPRLESFGVHLGVLCLAAFVFLHHFFPDGTEYWVFLQLLGYFAVARALVQGPHPLVSEISTLSFGVYLLHQPYFIKTSRLLLSPLGLTANIQFVFTWLLTIVLTTLAIKWLDGNRLAARFLLGKPIPKLATT
ncbi:MAG: acyltransferase [Bdellovibrionaceae bacterium]|nr:acyltransferase [Bdellovibrionales bacterium]MCB9255095.1 acyltransferase [Pseudobdellovibrionaceae bacterium]